MIKKYTLLSIALVLTQFIQASVISGAQVTYRNIGSYKFEVSYKVYRDCRGIGISANDYKIRCASSGTTKNLKATLVSITDITNPCRTGDYCKSPNNTNSGSSPKLEELLYRDTIDFNGAESSFKSCCIIQIGAGMCCRSASLTNGGSGNDFWVYSTLDLCNAPSNSSPVFSFNPDFAASLYEVFYNSYAAKDSIDGDSLSYAFAEPLTSFTGKLTFNSGFDYKNTFSAYFPASYNRASGPNPDANPPIGAYLDSKTGNFLAMPVANENSTVAITVKEWRKDSKGKYVQIGEITMEHPIFTFSNLNHTPRLNIKTSYNVCEGRPFTLEIASDDQQYNLPPPASPILNDTVSLEWDKGIKGAKFTLKNPNARNQEAVFEWTPATGDSKKLPANFTVIATDNNCNSKSRTTRTVQLKVYPKITAKSVIKKVNNSTYTVALSIDNKSYSYLASKYLTSANNVEDKRNYTFKSSKDLFSDIDSDTLVFKKNGTYIINQVFLSVTECNSVILRDTINVTNVMEVNLGITPLGHYPDTSICKGQKTRINANVTNASTPITYTWKYGKTTVTDNLGYFEQVFNTKDTLFLKIRDNNNQENSTFKVINIFEVPVIYAGQDQTICPDVKIKLKANSTKPENLTWAWILDSKVISSGDSVLTNAKGIYTVSATNDRNCTTFDTVQLNHFVPIKIDLISGKYCQDINSINQAAIIRGNPNVNFNFISFRLLKTLPNLIGGNNQISDLLTDLNPNADFDYKLSFDDARILINGSKDSLIFSASAVDTNNCFSTDTMSISILKKPSIVLSKKPIDKCMNISFSLDSSATASHTTQWFPYPTSGYGKWPSSSALIKGVINANYFSSPGKYKAKIEASNESCVAIDTLAFTILELPHPSIGILKYASAIRFRDETVNKKSSKWYINNTFYSSDDTILLSKSFVHLQPIKLEVIDNSGCMNDTTIVLNTQIGISPVTSSRVVLYPNPAGQAITLKQENTWVPTVFEVYNTVGQIVISGITNNRETQIDISALPSGFYYLNYLDKQSKMRLNFVKVSE